MGGYDDLLSLDWVSRLTHDELLSIFWLPSWARSRALVMERAVVSLQARLQRARTLGELAAELLITGGDLMDSLSKIGRAEDRRAHQAVE
jgi:hypothetical protein